MCKYELPFESYYLKDTESTKIIYHAASLVTKLVRFIGQKLGRFLMLQNICNKTTFELKADQMHFAHVTLRLDFETSYMNST